MPNWKEWLNNGDQYQRAGGGQKKASRFDPSIQYNVAALALECYVMAILDYHHTMPDNHTFTDFVEALEKVIQLDPELRQQILHHEQVQKICSFTDYIRKDISPEQIQDFKAVVNRIGILAHSICDNAVSNISL